LTERIDFPVSPAVSAALVAGYSPSRAFPACFELTIGVTTVTRHVVAVIALFVTSVAWLQIASVLLVSWGFNEVSAVFDATIARNAVTTQIDLNSLAHVIAVVISFGWRIIPYRDLT
jgi:hypothetical protein